LEKYKARKTDIASVEITFMVIVYIAFTAEFTRRTNFKCVNDTAEKPPHLNGSFAREPNP
jgi:hypothetical protein